MGAFGLVELQRVRERVEYRVRRAAEVPALEPYVAVHAHAREQGDLLAAKAGDATVPAVDGQPACCGVIRAQRALRNSRTSAAGVFLLLSAMLRIRRLLRRRSGRTCGGSSLAT